MASAIANLLAAIHDEFVEELAGLREFSSPADQTGLRRLSGRARVAAANGATLLLAALYEESVRQMVKAAFNYRRRTSGRRSSFPDKLPSVVWKRSLELMSRKALDDLIVESSQVDRQMKAIISFCIKGHLGADVSEAVSHNDSNMRPGEMARLFNQIGIQSLFSKLGDCEELKAYYGVSNSGQVAENAKVTLEDFFRRRNEIAHAIQIGASGGPASLRQDTEFFEAVSKSLKAVIVRELTA